MSDEYINEQPSSPRYSEDGDTFELLPPGATTSGGGGTTFRGSSNSLPPRAARWVILPSSTFRSRWIQVQLVIALYIIWVTPVRVGFDMPAEGFWFWLEGLIDIFFYVDLVLNFFTAYEDRITGAPITDHHAIVKNYLKGWFACDALATFPVEYIVRGIQGTWQCSFANDCSYALTTSSNVDIIRILRVLRVFRIVWIIKHFNHIRLSTVLGRFQNELYNVLPAMSILELIVVLLYLGHVSGCFFYYFSSPNWQTPKEKQLVNDGYLTTWLVNNMGGYKITMPPVAFNISTIPAGAPVPVTVHRDIVTGVWYKCPSWGYDVADCRSCQGPHMRCVSWFGLGHRYLASMYWAYTTMTTVGYGDIASITIAERMWAICTMIFSGFFFSFIIGRMAMVVSKLDARRQLQGEQLDMVAAFLKDTDLPRELSKRVMLFFGKQHVNPYDREQVLSRLPFELKSKIFRHLYSAAIRRVPLLQRHADDDIFLTDLCIRLQPYNCSADTFVYQRGETNGDVFILMRGELHVRDLDRESFMYKIPEWSVFGEGTVLKYLEGFEQAKRTDNVFCKTECQMLRVALEDMIDLLNQHPALLNGLKAYARARLFRKDQPRVGSSRRATNLAVGVVGAVAGGRPAAAAATTGPPIRAASAAANGVEESWPLIATAAEADNCGSGIIKQPPQLRHELDDLLTPSSNDRVSDGGNDHGNGMIGTAVAPSSSATVAATAAGGATAMHGPSPFSDDEIDNPFTVLAEAPMRRRPTSARSDGPGGPMALTSGIELTGTSLHRSGERRRLAARQSPSQRNLQSPNSQRNLQPSSATVTVPSSSRRHSDTDNGPPESEFSAAGRDALLEELVRLRRSVSEQQKQFADELQYQHYLMHQIPGRIMNHLVMVMGQPSEEQRRQLEQATLDWNKKYRWNI